LTAAFAVWLCVGIPLFAEDPEPAPSTAEAPAAEAPAPAPLPKWTSTAGDSIEAEFVEIAEDGRVILRTAEGALVQIPRDALVTGDQARLRTLEARQARQRWEEQRRAVEQCRAVIPAAYIHPNEQVLGRVETPRFDAVVLSTARMDLFIKEDGQYLAPPVRIGFFVGYYDTAERQHRQRRVLEHVEPPSWQDNVAFYRMNLEDEVYAEVRYVVGPDRLELGYHLRDPRRLDYPSNPRITFQFPRIFYEDEEFDPPRIYTPRTPEGIERAAFLNAISAYELRWIPLDTRRGETVRHAYNRSLNQMGYNVAAFEIGGGVFGPTTLRIERPRRGGILSGYIYPDNFPAQGFSISFAKEKHETPADREGEQLLVIFQ
jgi:hypothetical protein